jgi:hypothetical protein
VGRALVGGESRPAWVRSSPIGFSMSAKVGRLCAVTAVLELFIIISHSYGFCFRPGFHRNERFHGGPLRQRELLACIAAWRPGELHNILAFGRNRTPGLDTRRLLDPRDFLSRAGQLTCIDSICRSKV